MVDLREDAYCTLLMSDNYLQGDNYPLLELGEDVSRTDDKTGAMVLAHSLRDNGTTKKLAALITADSLSDSTVRELQSIYDYIIPVERITNQTPANLYLMNRPDLHSTFTKINLWRLQQFRKVVYLDADVVTLRAPDELFDIGVSFAAVPDIGWPDCFNSGVMVLDPNMGEYYALLALARRGISFDGADQGLLNMHFPRFHRLSFTYNCTPSGHYQYVPAYRHFQSSISVVHYIGPEKPWNQAREAATSGTVYDELLGRWWAVYDQHYRHLTLHHQREVLSQEALPFVEQHMRGDDADPEHSLTAAIETPMTEIHEAVIDASAHETSPSLPPLPPPTKPTAAGSRSASPPEPKAVFIAPMAPWDPSRSAPPLDSLPEAPNFPQQTYEMSQSSDLFRAPPPPLPPANLYRVPSPSSFTRRPKPIFPWESRPDNRKPTRVFNDDFDVSPPPTIASPPPSTSMTTGTETADSEEQLRSDLSATTTTPRSGQSSPPPIDSFRSHSPLLNAWDAMPEIDLYLSNLAFHSRRRGAIEVLSGGPDRDPNIHPPDSSPPRQRTSTRVTDFPTAIERPSLPVTPAPVPRPRYSGQSQIDQSVLPGAEGVPAQEDWDPAAKLEELIHYQPDGIPPSDTTTTAAPDNNSARHSNTSPTSSAAAVEIPAKKEIPNRVMPTSAMPVPTSPLTSPRDKTVGLGIGAVAVGGVAVGGVAVAVGGVSSSGVGGLLQGGRIVDVVASGG